MNDTAVSATERAINLALYIMHEQLFRDGNKRTANLAANALLVRSGAGVLSISTDNIAEFNRLLKYYYDTNDNMLLKGFLYAAAVIDFESKNVPVNSTEQRVLGILRGDAVATYDDIAETLGKTRKTAARAVATLKEQGLIRREGSDKSGSWVVLD